MKKIGNKIARNICLVMLFLNSFSWGLQIIHLRDSGGIILGMILEISVLYFTYIFNEWSKQSTGGVK